MSAPALRLIDGGRTNNQPGRTGPDQEPPTDTRPPTPRWWRWIVVQSLRHGKWWNPPFWMVRLILKRLRNRTVTRAMRTVYSEFGPPEDGRKLTPAFVRMMNARMYNPHFREACEHALMTHRFAPLGRFPVILDDEIKGRGAKTITNHLAWVGKRKLPDPLPWGFKP